MAGGNEDTRDLRLSLVVIILLLIPQVGLMNAMYLLMTVPVLKLIAKAIDMIASPFWDRWKRVEATKSRRLC